MLIRQAGCSVAATAYLLQRVDVQYRTEYAVAHSHKLYSHCVKQFLLNLPKWILKKMGSNYGPLYYTKKFKRVFHSDLLTKYVITLVE
jgi:hypothetical protein